MTTQYVGRDKQGRIIDPGFGSLSYQYKSITRVFRFWPEIVEQGQTLAGSTAQSQFFNHFYAKGHAPQPVGITGRVRDQDMYDDLASYIRAHQILLVSTRGSNNPDTSAARFQLPLMTLRIPSEGLVYSGWIDRFEGGARRFNVAPQFSFSFTSIEDRHSTNDKIVPSHALRSVFSGAFLTGPVSQQQATTEVTKGATSKTTAEQLGIANTIKTQITEPGSPNF